MMESLKEFSTTVGTFVVPTVNPSFIVGNSIKSEFGSLAQSSHKSTVKGGDNTDDLQWEAYLLGVPDPPIYSKEALRSLIRIKKQENKMPKFWKKWNTFYCKICRAYTCLCR